MQPAADRRLDDLRRWLEARTSADTNSLRPASSDASFRRYFRLDTADGTLIAMDAPPEQEDCRPFVDIAIHLAGMGLNVPHIIDKDFEQGFLLLSDLGSELYLRNLDDDSADALYGDAIDALLTIAERGDALRDSLPPYDGPFLKTEMALFHDWLCEKLLGLDFDAEAELEWQNLNKVLVDNALSQPRVFVHRDYHSRNLMVATHNPGILDFQDAMNGPLTYDLVSLLKDCYVRWPRDSVREWARRYFDQQPLATDFDTFLRWFDLMGVQRHLKASGIFARLNLRDGKPAYMQDVPRTLRYITALRDDYPELDWISKWIEDKVLPGLER